MKAHKGLHDVVLGHDAVLRDALQGSNFFGFANKSAVNGLARSGVIVSKNFLFSAAPGVCLEDDGDANLLSRSARPVRNSTGFVDVSDRPFDGKISVTFQGEL